jgi:hypothetical protein
MSRPGGRRPGRERAPHNTVGQVAIGVGLRVGLPGARLYQGMQGRHPSRRRLERAHACDLAGCVGAIERSWSAKMAPWNYAVHSDL